MGNDQLEFWFSLKNWKNQLGFTIFCILNLRVSYHFWKLMGWLLWGYNIIPDKFHGQGDIGLLKSTILRAITFFGSRSDKFFHINLSFLGHFRIFKSFNWGPLGPFQNANFRSKHSREKMKSIWVQE